MTWDATDGFDRIRERLFLIHGKRDGQQAEPANNGLDRGIRQSFEADPIPRLCAGGPPTINPRRVSSA
jgi:hypothetical protein